MAQYPGNFEFRHAARLRLAALLIDEKAYDEAGKLLASGRGVCGMPHWALHEYSSRGYVKGKRLGEKGLFATLYAAVRTDMLDAPYMRDFLLTAKDTSFATLDGVSAVR